MFALSKQIFLLRKIEKKKEKKEEKTTTKKNRRNFADSSLFGFRGFHGVSDYYLLLLLSLLVVEMDPVTQHLVCPSTPELLLSPCSSVGLQFFSLLFAMR